MNVLLLSPAFPPNVYLFCTALAARGGTVLGIGDSPRADVRDELSRALTEYAEVPSLADYDAVHRAAAGLISRHGRLDRVVSQIEIWLPHEARLREDFNIAGLRLADMERQRSKSGMAEIFAAAGIPVPPGERLTDLARARAFAARHGYPLIVKPDTGAGAAHTFTVDDDEALARAVKSERTDLLVQPFVPGDIVTFDGLADRDGRIVFCTAHRYDTGIMQVVSGGLDGHYYSFRDLPPALEDVGRRAVRAFDVRERFFHLEFFELPRRGGGDHRYVALEMNLRPPGGFTTDMMNYACDFDVYDLWARAVSGDDFAAFTYERKYHVAHAGRRDLVTYALSHDELVRELGDTLVLSRRLPGELSAMQGNVMYLLRHPDVTTLRAAIARVQERQT